MSAAQDRRWVEYLTDAECWRLLGTADVGRVGVLVDSAPEIYPVNYRIDELTIVFRSDSGSKLRGLERSPSVSFEVDHLDLEARSGWSILLKGRAKELTTPDEREGVSTLPLQHWGLGEKRHWVRITPTEITGRRLHHGIRSSQEVLDYPDGG